MKCKIKDIEVYYEDIGSGLPLVILHGMPLDHHHIFNDLEPLFVDRHGWRRIYPDLPGMGKTIAADWITNQDHMLDIILEFIEKVAPGERFTVAGTSYGGYLARGVINRKGKHIDGMFINVPSVETNEIKKDLPKHRVIKESQEFLAALTPDEQDLRSLIVTQSLELLQDFRSWFSPAGAMADQAFLERLNKNFSLSFSVDALPEPFPAPTLILTGRFDHWCGYREAYKLLENYPRATYAVLDKAGHALASEQKTLFRALVNEWLDRVEEYAKENAST
jgi:pimeloyl-ACP methyl ester carboxylesterase